MDLVIQFQDIPEKNKSDARKILLFFLLCMTRQNPLPPEMVEEIASLFIVRFVETLPRPKLLSCCSISSIKEDKELRKLLRRMRRRARLGNL